MMQVQTMKEQQNNNHNKNHINTAVWMVVSANLSFCGSKLHRMYVTDVH